MRNFRTYHLAREFYQSCEKLQFTGALKNQFERASLSILLNLAEGSGKLTAKDRRRFYSISMGSLRETQALLSIKNQNNVLIQSDHLAAYIFRLIQNPGGSA